MSATATTPSFTGEFFVPGQSDARMEADHVERYRFATRHAKDARVLDIACGMGYASSIFLDAGAKEYFGVDINPELTTHASHAYGSELARYSTGDICEHQSDEPYDLVCCFETIEHVARYQDAITNLFTLLRPGGTLVISSPNRNVTSPGRDFDEQPANPYHTQEFLPEELIGVLQERGFQTDQTSVYGQRLRRMYRIKLLNRITKLALGSPKKKASPVVQPAGNKTPRYFVLVATRPM
jgi:SAM-dependent methyltransferase